MSPMNPNHLFFSRFVYLVQSFEECILFNRYNYHKMHYWQHWPIRELLDYRWQILLSERLEVFYWKYCIPKGKHALYNSNRLTYQVFIPIYRIIESWETLSDIVNDYDYVNLIGRLNWDFHEHTQITELENCLWFFSNIKLSYV